MAMTTEILSVTPEVARRMLDADLSLGNVHVFDQAKVDLYAEQMRNGEWDDAGSLVYEPDGALSDGRHRLRAIVASGVTLALTVHRQT